MVLYLDSSAIVKLIQEEDASRALAAEVKAAEALVTSSLARVEVTRAVNRYLQSAVPVANEVLARINMIEVDDGIIDAAAHLTPVSLRSLDAIHIASATALGTDLDALITYDRRMADAAEQHGLAVRSPS